MKLYFYGICGLVSIFWLHSTSAGSMLSHQSDDHISKNQFIKQSNQTISAFIDSKLTKQNKERRKNLNVQNVTLNTTSIGVSETTRPKLAISFKLNEKRKDVVLKAIEEMLEEKYRQRKQFTINTKQDRLHKHDIDFIAATDLVTTVLAKSRSKRFAKPEKEIGLVYETASDLAPLETVDTKVDETDNPVISQTALANNLKISAEKTDILNTRVDKSYNSNLGLVKLPLPKFRSKRCSKKTKNVKTTDNLSHSFSDLTYLIKTRSRSSEPIRTLNTRIDEIDNTASDIEQIAQEKTRSKRYAKPEKINTKIDEINNGRDIVLEAVKQLIDKEKTRRRFDMADPPNSKYSKRQQLLWERLRIKAAEELLLHPKLLPQRVTERIFDTLKWDVELATPEPTMEPGLFNEFKRRIEKQHYMDEYERGRGREFISTLKPWMYE